MLQPIKKVRFGRDRDVHNLRVSMVLIGSYRHSEVPPLPETIRKISSKLRIDIVQYYTRPVQTLYV